MFEDDVVYANSDHSLGPVLALTVAGWLEWKAQGNAFRFLMTITGEGEAEGQRITKDQCQRLVAELEVQRGFADPEEEAMAKVAAEKGFTFLRFHNPEVGKDQMLLRCLGNGSVNTILERNTESGSTNLASPEVSYFRTYLQFLGFAAPITKGMLARYKGAA